MEKISLGVNFITLRDVQSSAKIILNLSKIKRTMYETDETFLHR